MATAFAIFQGHLESSKKIVLFCLKGTGSATRIESTVKLGHN